MESAGSKGWKILIPKTALIPEAEKYLGDRGHTIIPYFTKSGEELRAELRAHKPDAIIIRDAKADRAFFEAAAPNLKAIARYGAGYDGVDLDAADEFGVTCTYAPIGNSFSVAEVAMFHLLHAALRIEVVRKNMMVDFMLAKQRTPYNNLAGKTVVPFFTSGGSQLGEGQGRIEMLAKGAKVLGGKRFPARASERELTGWVAGLQLG